MTLLPSPLIPAPPFRTKQRPAFVGHSFGGGTVLQVLSDERQRQSASSGDGGVGKDPEETGYSVAVVMDAWTYPTSDEARAQSVDIPVRDLYFCVRAHVCRMREEKGRASVGLDAVVCVARSRDSGGICRVRLVGARCFGGF